MPNIPLDRLVAHPDNANRMSPAMFKKLVDHIRESGDYPPLIVRRHPANAHEYEILDGHHRAEVLRQLGHAHAACEVWQADDDRAALLLATLNRLHGEDDPHRRGALLGRLSKSMGIESLAKLVPDEARRIKALIESTHAAPPAADPPKLPDMPHALTFFLTGRQRDALLKQLNPISRDRSEALVTLLRLNGQCEAPQRGEASFSF